MIVNHQSVNVIQFITVTLKGPNVSVYASLTLNCFEKFHCGVNHSISHSGMVRDGIKRVVDYAVVMCSYRVLLMVHRLLVCYY